MSRSARLKEQIPEAVEAKHLLLSDKQWDEFIKSRERESKRQYAHERFLEQMNILKLKIVGGLSVLYLVIVGIIIHFIAKTSPNALQYAVPSLLSPILIIILGAKKYLQKNDKSDDK